MVYTINYSTFDKNLQAMKFGFLLLLLLGFTLANGQVVISGKMTDLKNKPLRGASVSIKDSYDRSTTDSLGMFRFTTTEKGNMVLEATISGYTSYIKNITLEDKDIVLNIQVKELITELNAVHAQKIFKANNKCKTII